MDLLRLPTARRSSPSVLRRKILRVGSGRDGASGGSNTLKKAATKRNFFQSHYRMNFPH